MSNDRNLKQKRKKTEKKRSQCKYCKANVKVLYLTFFCSVKFRLFIKGENSDESCNKAVTFIPFDRSEQMR